MKKNTNHLVSLILSEPLNYEKLLEVPTEELEFLKDECDVVMKEIKNQIIKEYEIIKPSLIKMRDWKHQLKQLKDKRETYKTFISIDKNTSLFSASSLSSVNIIPTVSFSELFKDIENDKLIDDSPTPSTKNVSKIIKPVTIEPKKPIQKPPLKFAKKSYK